MRVEQPITTKDSINKLLDILPIKFRQKIIVPLLLLNIKFGGTPSQHEVRWKLRDLEPKRRERDQFVAEIKKTRQALLQNPNVTLAIQQMAEAMRENPQSVVNWNQGRRKRTGIPELSGLDLSGAKDLQNINLGNADLGYANFSDSEANKSKFEGSVADNANFDNADYRGASFRGTHLDKATFRSAKLEGTNFEEAQLLRADFTGANLAGADLSFAQTRETNFSGANLDGARVVGVHPDGCILKNTSQRNLVASAVGEPLMVVDGLVAANAIRLFRDGSITREALHGLMSKSVLFLGRFTPERKTRLDLLAEATRKLKCIPLINDFAQLENRTLNETTIALASISKFIVVDLTDPKSVPDEIAYIVPNFPSVIMVPIIEKGHQPHATFEHYRHMPWMANLIEYDKNEDPDQLAQKILSQYEITTMLERKRVRERDN